MKKKLGPLPVWAWGVIFGVAGYLYLRQRSSSSSSSTSPVASVLDPNAIDPNTGLTYGQEESAAMNGGLAATAGYSGGGTLPATGNLGGGNLGDTLTNFDQELMAFLQAQQDFGQLAGVLGYTPPATSPTTAVAAASPPLNNASPPTITPATTYPTTAGSAIVAAAGPPKGIAFTPTVIARAPAVDLVGHAIGHSPAYTGPGTYVIAGPTNMGLRAVGHSPAYRGPGTYVPV